MQSKAGASPVMEMWGIEPQSYIKVSLLLDVMLRTFRRIIEPKL